MWKNAQLWSLQHSSQLSIGQADRKLTRPYNLKTLSTTIKRTEIIQKMLSDHNGIKIKINNRNITKC